MYAVVVREEGDPDTITGSGEHLAENVLPRTRQAGGIVSALWMTDRSGGALNVLVFEDESSARAALAPVERAPRPASMSVQSVELFQVLARF